MKNKLTAGEKRVGLYTNILTAVLQCNKQNSCPV